MICVCDIEVIWFNGALGFIIWMDTFLCCAGKSIHVTPLVDDFWIILTQLKHQTLCHYTNSLKCLAFALFAQRPNHSHTKTILWQCHNRVRFLQQCPIHNDTWRRAQKNGQNVWDASNMRLSCMTWILIRAQKACAFRVYAQIWWARYVLDKRDTYSLYRWNEALTPASVVLLRSRLGLWTMVQVQGR